ncbi:MAG: lactate utilization protein C [Rhodocyclales bacterium GWA2_65_19]|nr:MAG: lactate utilization protein C [Rhodocyclales bacterium GWA2_65_19]
MSARENILGRLRAAPTGTPAPLPDLAAWRALRPPVADAAASLALFRTNIEAAHAEVHDTTAQDWPALLARLAAAKGVQTLLFGPATAHGAQLSASAPPGVQLVPYDRPADQWRDLLFDGIDASLTAAVSAIADTGSLILWPDAHEPRLMSLVPPIHFVLFDAARIHLDLHAAMRAEAWATRMPTNALVISGPSKTADIQQTLAYGAHGPRELIVLLCHSNGGQP